MTNTLLLRLAGPMQAWGVTSKYNTRTTGREPSKSGVIGMIASAMGRGRDEPIEDLTSLKFGVRVDQEGRLLKDFHTAHHPSNGKLAFITDRYYLADALFLVGLEGDKALLEKIEHALRSPAYPLYLGRRSCPPAGKVSLGLRALPLRQALSEEEWQASEWYRRRNDPEYLEMVFDSESDDGTIVRDMPVSFSQNRRQYGFRKVSHIIDGKQLDSPADSEKLEKPTMHDAFEEVRRSVRCTFRESK